MADARRAHDAARHQPRRGDDRPADRAAESPRAWRNDLDEQMVDASPQRPLLLLLFDLNGFKSYNDIYGHPAGDALLTRLGSALTRAVDGRGHAYRMGGDEFCVLTAAPADQHAELAALTRAALSERGDGFAITAALGSATIDAPDSDRDDALRDADRRMYAEKNGRRGSAGGQSAAVLLRVLTERHPDLGDHVDSVAALTEQVGLELGMTEEDRTTLWQAAALHDIGKAAVPDAILDKPGPLDEDEWAFMRRHTIIGERILDGAPALTAAARLVRSSHERFDGTGYPDQLAGAAIPLGARIVAVCDAYDAMVSDRPYRRAMPSEQAIAGAHPVRRHAVRSRRCQVMRRMTRVMTRPMIGSPSRRPSATTIALATTARLTRPSLRAWLPSAISAGLSRRSPGAQADLGGDLVADEADRAGRGERCRGDRRSAGRSGARPTPRRRRRR